MYQRFPVSKGIKTWASDVALSVTVDPTVSAQFRGASVFASAAHALVNLGGVAVFVIHRESPVHMGHHVALETLVFCFALDHFDNKTLRLCGERDEPDSAGSETIHVDNPESPAEVAVALSMFVLARVRQFRDAEWCLWHHAE